MKINGELHYLLPVRYSTFISYNHNDRIWAIVASDAQRKIELRLKSPEDLAGASIETVLSPPQRSAKRMFLMAQLVT